MKTLYAPWRKSYIIQNRDSREKDGCTFCLKIEEGASAGSLVIAIKGSMTLILNKFPYSLGHVMVLPTAHTPEFDDLKSEDLVLAWDLTQRVISGISKAFGPIGFHVGYNLGQASGAGIPKHIHQHIVPRYKNDLHQNYYEQKEIDLDYVYDKIAKYFNN